MSLFTSFHLLTFPIMILTTEEFNEFANQYPELADCVCLDEVIVSIDELMFGDYEVHN